MFGSGGGFGLTRGLRNWDRPETRPDKQSYANLSHALLLDRATIEALYTKQPIRRDHYFYLKIIYAAMKRPVERIFVRINEPVDGPENFSSLWWELAFRMEPDLATEIAPSVAESEILAYISV
jgi:hypothetical protein